MSIGWTSGWQQVPADRITKPYIAVPPVTKRLLVVGAGATIEECRRSGKRRDDPNFDFPTIRNFARKFFQPFPMPMLDATSDKLALISQPYQFALAEGVAGYLMSHGISYNETLLHPKDGMTIDKTVIDESPIGIFLKLEETNFHEHNIERLCEFVWRNFGSTPEFWDSFLYNSVYFGLFALFTEQFGLGQGVPMNAGTRVANTLSNDDAVLNLNYDVAFDLALKQASKPIAYSPGVRSGSISIYKPHGSLNLYCDYVSGDFAFVEPDNIPGSARMKRPDGSNISARSGILPPRLNKAYADHPFAEYILESSKTLSPELLTFWGVGLTESDADLVDLYRKWAARAQRIEFINPSDEAFHAATRLLGGNVLHFKTLDSWIAFSENLPLAKQYPV